MEASATTLLKILLPKSPLILKTTLSHALSLSPTASKWDFRTALTITILRDMLGGPNAKPTSITKQQRLTTRDPGVKGNVWISKLKCDVPPEDHVRETVFGAIKEMGTGDEEKWDEPFAAPVEGEWTGYRKEATPQTPEPAQLSEPQKYEALMKETTSKVTILYLHGGAMYLLDPATYRHVTSRLAKETGGRVFSVRYRLAPQNPFPAALLDALMAYLTLLYPPPGAPHAPVPANEIVFGGDSAGGNLCTALLQLLLQIHRSATPGSTPKVRFHGEARDLPLPAGLALSSPWLDVARSLPSMEAFAKYDYLPPPSASHASRFPTCPAWPTDPPRADLYCEGSALLHPLVSPLAAKDWSNSPPVFFSLGQEMLRDEAAVLASRLARQGVAVVWREFECMPHCFAMMLEGTGESRLHYAEYAKFCRDVVEMKKGGGEEGVKTNGEFILAKTLKRQEVDVRTGLTDLTEEKVDDLMRRGRKRIEGKLVEGEVEARPML
ncbi:uncharacterized protein EI97DRAFT_435514 [Westerdykella ornata]|uniref:Alpha/beta hydrolase fold-3 domain-containing protein n=1 Tax=Westerdykella ornata TaxID=318751 RepID=A0A6A6JC57_WESOR|nr:uncharacterized protein EI97DRAFT_435514 [Westerdykella ornata]KAF2274151.1 hypothetical protein EI97DRAFT_435514 [Westerdykella ornata]